MIPIIKGTKWRRLLWILCAVIVVPFIYLVIQSRCYIIIEVVNNTNISLKDFTIRYGEDGVRYKIRELTNGQSTFFIGENPFSFLDLFYEYSPTLTFVDSNDEKRRIRIPNKKKLIKFTVHIWSEENAEIDDEFSFFKAIQVLYYFEPGQIVIGSH